VPVVFPSFAPPLPPARGALVVRRFSEPGEIRKFDEEDAEEEEDEDEDANDEDAPLPL
jgi:hypothetical protein